MLFKIEIFTYWITFAVNTLHNSTQRYTASNRHYSLLVYRDHLLVSSLLHNSTKLETYNSKRQLKMLYGKIFMYIGATLVYKKGRISSEPAFILI